MALLFCASVYYFYGMQSPAVITLDWLPALGINLSFYVDGLSRLFVFLITGIGFFIFLFSGSYLKSHEHFSRFFLYLHLFTIAMLGVVLADNLITLFVFWELTSLTSYLLIGFSHRERLSRRAALQGLLITGSGGLCLLAGVILIQVATGTFSISTILTDNAMLHEHHLATPILILVGLGALTKSAQFPFHFWLPNAMEAPTPVSAFLHSATMVKAGVYLLARLHPELSLAELWEPILATCGSITALLGAILALKQKDLKKMLAYTTLMALGTLVALLSQPDSAVFAGAMAFLVAHALYKAALFLSVGAIDHALHEKKFRTIIGLWSRHRAFAAAILLASLSLAGLPPAIGFIAKEMLYDGLVNANDVALPLLMALIIANACMVALALGMARRIIQPLTRKTQASFQSQEIAGPIVLAGLGILTALGAVWIDPLIRETLMLSSRDSIPALGLWHGFNLALGVSIITILIGVLIAKVHPQLFKRLNRAKGFTFDQLWDDFLIGFNRFCVAVTKIVQTERFSDDLSKVLATFLIIGFLIVFKHDAWPVWTWDGAPLNLWLIGALIIAGTLMSLVAQSRIAAITSLGVVGIGVALIFILFGAPDVAITQLLVETLLVVLIAVALLNLPSLPVQKTVRVGHAFLSIGFGLIVTLTLLGITSSDLDRTLTTFFEGASWTEAYGRNIVNVILVDFRALDTFGEIAVVLIAAIGAIALLSDMRARKQ
jgi:multicomponent Na+:H+ antiporter subunit A